MLTRRLHLPSLGIAALVLFGAGAPLAAQITQVVSCPLGGIFDNITRGIYVQSFPGNNLKSVELAYSTDTTATYEVSITAHRGSFGGPQVGATQTAVVNLTNGVSTPVIFDFGGAPITPGDLLTFTQAKLGGPPAGRVFFDAGPCTSEGCSTCPGIFETEDTKPPLSIRQRKSAGLTIFENDVPGPCIPSDTVLCIDNLPGDQRFKARISFATTQGGGFSGDGQAIPLASLGVAHGGLFWFFGQDNPEMLLKILNACALNGRFWVFFSAGTNVGFTLTVTDTVTGRLKIYINPDLTPAPPIQDTGALPCP